MKQLALALVLLWSAAITAQERITDLKSDSYLAQTFHSEIGDELYTIEVDQNDFVNVYVQSTLADRSFLHRAYIPSSYTTFTSNVAATESHMFFNQEKGIISYDFVNDSQYKATLPGDWISRQSWREYQDRVVLITEDKMTGERNEFLFQHGKGFVDINDCVQEFVSEDNIICSTYDPVAKLHTYDIENLSSGSVHRLIDPSSKTVWMTAEDMILYYADSLGVHAYDMDENVKSTLLSKEYLHSRLRLDIRGRNLFIVNESLFRDALSLDIIDLDTKEVVQSYDFISEGDIDNYAIHDNFLILYHRGFATDELVLINHWNEKITRYQDFSRPDDHIANTLAGDIFICQASDGLDENNEFLNKFHQIDLGKEDHSEPMPLSYSYTRGVTGHKVFELEDGLLIEQRFHYLSDAVRTLAVSGNQVTVVEHLFDLQSGFSDDADLFIFEGLLHVLDRNFLYRVENDNLIQVNSEPLGRLLQNYNRLKPHQGLLLWVEGPEDHLYAYDGKSVEFINALRDQEDPRLSYAADFVLLEECMYYLGAEDAFYRMDLITKEITVLDKFVANNMNYSLYEYKGECYYVEGETNLFKIDCAGNKVLLNDNFDNWSWDFHDLEPFDFQGKGHIWSGNGLHQFGENAVTLILESEFSITSQSFTTDDGLRILWTNDDGVFVFDGEETTILFEGNSYFINPNDDGTFFIYVYDEQIQYIFDPRTENLQALENVEDDLRINAFVIGDKLYHQTRKNLYEVSDDYASAVVVWTIFNPLNASPGTSHSQFGLIALGDAFLCIDPDNNIFQIDQLTTPLKRNVLDIDSTAYFIASEPVNGNQLYKIDFSKLTPDHLDLDLVTYPNPTSDYITLKEDLSDFRYEIYNQKGISVQAGQSTSKHIAVKELLSGLYFLRVEDGSRTRLAKVIIQ